MITASMASGRAPEEKPAGLCWLSTMLTNSKHAVAGPNQKSIPTRYDAEDGRGNNFCSSLADGWRGVQERN